MEVEQNTSGQIDANIETSLNENTTKTNKPEDKFSSNIDSDPMSDRFEPGVKHDLAVDKFESVPSSKDDTDECRKITTANTNDNPVSANTGTSAKMSVVEDYNVTALSEKMPKTTETDSVSVPCDEFDQMNNQVNTENESGAIHKDASNGCMEIATEDSNDNRITVDKEPKGSEVPGEKNVTLMEYRSRDIAVPTADSSDTEDSSSDSSHEEEEDAKQDGAEHESTENKINRALSERDESPDRDRRVKLNRYGLEDVRTKGELLPEDLPPLEELTITVDESVEMTKVGTVKSVIGILVIIQTCENVPPLNEDTILFIEGHQVLGQVFEVFGPVQTPWYSIRFNDEENIKNKGLEAGMPVYCAPKEETFTKYVFVDSLKSIKGSDASWEDNNEPPDKYVEYSDDESERRAKTKRKKKKPGNNRETMEEENQPNADNQSKRSRKPNNHPQHSQGGPGQQQQFRPNNPFQSGGNYMNRARYPGGNFNQRQAYNPRGPRWAGHGNGNNTVSPRFGGPPRFQPQVNGHGSHMQYAPANIQHGSNMPRQGFPQGNNIPQQGFPPERCVGSMPRPGFSGEVRPGMESQGPANSCNPRFQKPPSSAPTFQNNLSQPNLQGNGPFRTDVPPPAFNAVGLNNQRNNSGQNFNNSGQGQPTFCQASQQTQNTPANQFVGNSNPQFSQSTNMNNQFQNTAPFQPGRHNQFGNNTNQQFSVNAPTNQFQPNCNSQVTTTHPIGCNQHPQSVQNSQNQFQNMHAPNQNMFQGNNQPNTSYNQSNAPLNANNAPRNQLRIHSLNPGLQSNNCNAPVAPVNNGYEPVQLNSTNIKPYRPELGQPNNGPTNFSGVPPPASVNSTVNTGQFQVGNCNMNNTRPGLMGQGQQSQFGYQTGPQSNNIQRPGAPGMNQQNFSNFQQGIIDQRFIQNNQS